MVDVHCHILPGLDDGARDIQESLAMAQAAIEEGVTHVVATPHSSNEYRFNYTRVRQLREQLQRLVGDRLVLATGCDFRINLENLDALKQEAPRFCINQRNYLLVEFSEFSIPPTMNHTLHDMQLMGLRPVITHPERNAILQAQPGRLAAWVQRNDSAVRRAAQTLTEIWESNAFTVATLSVAVRAVRTLVTTATLPT